MITDIQAYIRKLISLYEHQKDINNGLRDRLEGVIREKEALEKKVEELGRKLDNAKLAGAFTGTGDNFLAKERIDKLVREIDRCIELMEN